MHAIVRMERLRNVCGSRVVVLGALLLLGSFIPLAGAEMASPAKPADEVVLGMPADALPAMSSAPEACGVAVLAEDAIDAGAPLPGTLVAGQADPLPQLAAPTTTSDAAPTPTCSNGIRCPTDQTKCACPKKNPQDPTRCPPCGNPSESQ